VTNVDVLIIGGGQAGLGAGYYLRDSKKTFLIIDAASRTGDSWRQRWDTLKLFTPRPFAALPGMKLPKSYSYYPSKNEFADYFDLYAKTFNLPIKHGSRVTKLEKKNGAYIAHTKDEIIYATQVIIASGPFQNPLIPRCADKLLAEILQLHSSQYKNLSQVPNGDVLIVGGGNSGAQLAIELSQEHRVTIATSGYPWFLPASLFGVSLYWFIYFTRILSADKDAWVSRYVKRMGDGIVGKDLRKLIKQGTVELIPHRLIDCKGDNVYFDNGERRKVTNIIWATGFESSYEWVSINGAVNSNGLPVHERGISPETGLYWLGLPWQTALNSAIINGIKKDAKLIVDHLLKI
jgi:putative flavoprotein involved in K+ transport